MTESTEKVLLLNEIQLARAAQRNREATEKLLERLYPKIYQVIWSVVRTKEQAEEIEQAAVLEVLKYLGKYRGEGSLEAWAGEITYRTAMKNLSRSWRWRQRHTPFTEDFKENVDESAQGISPERTVSKERTYQMLADKMEGIPEDQRSAFMMHIVHGYSVKEVSEIMKVSVNTTKYRLKSATKEMRTIFDENPELRDAMLEAGR